MIFKYGTEIAETDTSGWSYFRGRRPALTTLGRVDGFDPEFLAQGHKHPRQQVWRWRAQAAAFDIGSVASIGVWSRAERSRAEKQGFGILPRSDYEEATLFDATRHHLIDIGTPGAIMLVFQAILPFLLFHQPLVASPDTVSEERVPINVTIKGGTNVSNSPSYDYIDQVLLPTLSLIGLPPIAANLNNRGWNTGRPEMGSVTFSVTPLQPLTGLPAFALRNRGTITGIKATVLAPRQVEKDFQRELRKSLKNTLPDIKNFEMTFEDSRHQNRLYVLLVATTENGMKLGRDYLYDRKISNYSHAVIQMARQVAEELAGEIEHGGCVDSWMRDQLVVFQALSGGAANGPVTKPVESSTADPSKTSKAVEQAESTSSEISPGQGSGAEKVEMSLHAQTAWWVCEQLLGIRRQDTVNMEACQGVALVTGTKFSHTTNSEEKSVDGESDVEDLQNQLKHGLQLRD